MVHGFSSIPSATDNLPGRRALPMSVLVGEAEVREQLMASNEELRRLVAEHKAYADELERLTGRPHLSEDEKLQETVLKKKKLMLKDQMYSMVQKHRRELEARI